MLFKKSRAQGTIEYLIILAIIVVIGLIVVGMLVSMNDSGDITAKNNNLKNLIGTGGISVVEAVLGDDGDAAITFKNISGDTLTIQSLANGDVSGTFLLTAPNSKVFTLYLSSLGSECVCESGMKNKSCDFELTKSKHVNSEIISEKVFFTIILDCVDDVNGNNFTYEYVDSVSPVVSLISPTNSSTTRNNDINLAFSVNDTSAINDCNVYLDGTLQEQIISPSKNTPIYSLSSDLSYTNHDFNVVCADVNNNIGNSSTNNFTIEQGTMIINLTAPSNGETVSGPINFEFDVNDMDFDIDYCELILDGVVNAKLNNITEGATMRFAHPGIANDNYTWDINCVNTNGDENNNSQTLIVNTSLPSEDHLFFTGRGGLSNYGVYYFNAQSSSEPEFLKIWTFDANPDYGLVQDANSNLWLSPVESDMLKEKINSSGDILYSTQFSGYIGVEASDGYGSIYDSNNTSSETLNKNDFNGNLIDTFNIGFPIGLVAIDLNKHIWVLENSALAGSIKKLDISGNVLGTYSLERATNNLRNLVVDLDNNLWAIDYSTSQLIKISQTGSILGTYSVGTNPLDVKVDMDNNLWVNDSDNIYKVSQTGTILQTIDLGTLSLLENKPINNNSNIIYFGGEPQRKISNSIAITSDGNIWAPGYEGTTGYLYKISPDGATFTQYTSSSKEEFKGIGDFSGFGLQYFILGRR